jgi:hypothetical protein
VLKRGACADCRIQVDTTAKRLMSNYGRISSASQLNSVVFKDKAGASITGRFFSLFPGLGYAAVYKVLAMIAVVDNVLMSCRYCSEFTSTEGSRLSGIY